MNWCGRLKTSMEAPETASSREGLAMRFVGKAISGRYLTFSWK